MTATKLSKLHFNRFFKKKVWPLALPVLNLYDILVWFILKVKVPFVDLRHLS